VYGVKTLPSWRFKTLPSWWANGLESSIVVKLFVAGKGNSTMIVAFCYVE